MFHLILHVWYKSGHKREYYYWEYEPLIVKVKKLQGNGRIERYEVEDRHKTDKKRWLGSV